MDAPRTRLSGVYPADATAVLRVTVLDDDNVTPLPTPDVVLETLTLTLFEVRSRVVVNGCLARDILNANGGAVYSAVQTSATDGKTYNTLVQLAAADMGAVTGNGSETHVARIDWAWSTGTKSGWREIEFTVASPATVGSSAPAGDETAAAASPWSRAGAVISPIIVGDSVRLDANAYLNVGPTAGPNGYGFRDNAGAIEYKNAAGDWTAFGPADTDRVIAETATTYRALYGLQSSVTIVPTGDTSGGLYYCNDYLVAIDAANIYPVGSLNGRRLKLTLAGSGAVPQAYSDIISVNNTCTGVVGYVKGPWVTLANYESVGVMYGHELSLSNYGAHAGTLRGFSVQVTNRYNSYLGIDNPTVDIAEGLAVSLLNEADTVGGTQTMTSGKGLAWTLRNDGVIGAAYFVYLSTPINTGTLSKYHAIHLDDQSVAGCADNYALWCGGGKWHLAGQANYANDTAAKAGGLLVGDVYRNGSILMVVAA